MSTWEERMAERAKRTMHYSAVELWAERTKPVTTNKAEPDKWYAWGIYIFDGETTKLELGPEIPNPYGEDDF
jgi:hypothetical protein